jgi:hypothetical protein
MDARAKELMDIGSGLLAKRTDLNTLWQETAEQFYPERATFTLRRSLGDEFADHLMSSYPSMARQELGNTLSAYLRPKSQQWFRMSSKDEELDEQDDVRVWMESRTGVVWNALYDPLSGFVRATKEADHDYATFGQAVISVEPNSDMDGLLFRSWHLKDVAWTEGLPGKVDAVYRQWKPAARTLMRMFPKTVSAEVQNCANSKPQDEVDAWHIVVPVDDYDMPKSRARGARFVSIYVDATGQKVLEERPRPELGYVIPRWKTLSGSQYAYSPCTAMMLPDARLLQAVTRVLLEAGEKAVDPPMLAIGEALRSDMALYAGGVTFVEFDYDERTGDPLRPIQQPGHMNLAYGMEVARDLRALMDRGFFLDQLKLPADPRTMTAYEVRKRIEEYVRRLGPLFEPVEEEYSAPLLDEALGIIIRMGGLGPAQEIPEDLRGREIEFKFDSPLQDSQEQIKGQQFIQLVETTGAAMQFDPNVARNVDWLGAHRDAIRGSGLPADWLVPAEVVAQGIEGERQAAALQEAAQAVDIGAAVAGNVGDAAVKLRQGGML